MTSKPRCVIVTGRPGSGKATLCKKIQPRLWMPVVSRDEIKEGYVNTFGVKHDELPPDTNAVATNLFFEIVYQHLANNVSIIIEAAFQHNVWEARIVRITELASPFMIICDVDAETAANRHLQRGLAEPEREFYHGDKRVVDYRKTGVILPPAPYETPHFDLPTVHVSTYDEYSPTIDEIIRKIRLRSPRLSVVPHRPEWQADFEKEAALVRKALGENVVAVHHIGSTSIPGIYAKPVIDILVEVNDIDAVDERTALMESLGYEVMGEFGIQGRRYFRKDSENGARTHQIHTFQAGSDHVIRHIAFRDYMIAHPGEAQRYSELKRQLSAAHPFDADAYMDGKDPFIQECDRRAAVWINANKEQK